MRIWRELIVGLVILTVLALFVSTVLTAITQAHFDAQARELVRPVRVPYRVPAGPPGCELWDRIRYACEPELSDTQGGQNRNVNSTGE